MPHRKRARNASQARQSFVTRRAEVKLDALAALFKSAAGEHWTRTVSGVLRRELFFTGLPYLDTLGLIYNWENRFLSVNYNLQLESRVSVEGRPFTETGGCRLALRCTQRRGQREYSWDSVLRPPDSEALEACRGRLANPLITERLSALDIMELELSHQEGGCWQISCESLIGSSTWLLIPPVLSMITPRREECVKFLELFQLLGDAVANNR